MLNLSDKDAVEGMERRGGRFTAAPDSSYRRMMKMAVNEQREGCLWSEEVNVER